MFNKIESTDLRPMREKVLSELRGAIFENRLKPGHRLVENIIASSMGVSRTPVREALRQLEIEGLAANIPRKGTIVKGISIEDIYINKNIKEIRLLPEVTPYFFDLFQTKMLLLLIKT